MLGYFFILFFVPALVSLALTPAVMRLARRVGAMDAPDERKIHSKLMPRMGGVAIAGSLLICVMGLKLALPNSGLAFDESPLHLGLMAAALALVLALGIWDDITPLRPGKKFLFQVLIGTLVYFAGFRISAIGHPFTQGLLTLGYLDYPATILWIVGVTNALNLIDGLDGLAAGIAMIASLTVCGVAYLWGDYSTAFVAVIAAGAIFGFLRYNFYPARIFLGDSGSLFLGLILALLTLHSPAKRTTVFALLVPVLALGLPILDTMLSMLRRFLHPFMPRRDERMGTFNILRSIFLPDRRHIHHQLLARGFSHRKVVLLMYAVSASLGMCALALSVTDNIVALGIFLVFAVALAYGIRQLGYREILLHRNGILQRLLVDLYELPALRRPWLQVTVDVAFAALSFQAAHLLLEVPHLAGMGEHRNLFTLIAIVTAQVAVFGVTGLYRQATRHVAIGDAIRTLRCVVAGSAAAAAVAFVFSNDSPALVAAFALIDFFLVASLVLASRFSFGILNYLLHRDRVGKKRALIFGAGQLGVVVFNHILDSETLNLVPVGFIDEDAALDEKIVCGYPIVGGFERLEEYLEGGPLDEILIADPPRTPESYGRLRALAAEHRVVLRRFAITDTVESTDALRDPSAPQLVVEGGER